MVVRGNGVIPNGEDKRPKHQQKDIPGERIREVSECVGDGFQPPAAAVRTMHSWWRVGLQVGRHAGGACRIFGGEVRRRFCFGKAYSFPAAHAGGMGGRRDMAMAFDGSFHARAHPSSWDRCAKQEALPCSGNVEHNRISLKHRSCQDGICWICGRKRCAPDQGKAMARQICRIPDYTSQVFCSQSPCLSQRDTGVALRRRCRLGALARALTNRVF